MALKNMKTEEMLQISGRWINPKSDAHAAILKVPELEAKLERMNDTHGVLAQAAQPAEDSRLTEISEEEIELDLRHDSIIRGSFGYLGSSAELIGGDKGETFITLQGKLIPGGLSSQQKSYRAQAGQAAQLADRLTPELRAETDAISIGKGADAKSLTTYLDEWIAIGKRFGALEDEKGTLLALQSKDTPNMDLVKARNKWIRLVNSFVADGELAELDAQLDALIFGPLLDAEKKADTRARTAPPVTPKEGEGSEGEKKAQ